MEIGRVSDRDNPTVAPPPSRNERARGFKIFDRRVWRAYSPKPETTSIVLYRVEFLPPIAKTHLTELEFNQDGANKRVWLRLYFFADDLTRWGITHAQMLQNARLAGKFHEVRCKRKINSRKLLCRCRAPQDPTRALPVEL
jgi:hypothetical protein